jgi:hypothetical protein
MNMWTPARHVPPRPLRMAFCIAAGIIALMGAPQVAQASDMWSPFFMFTTSKFGNAGERTDALNALSTYATSADYLSSGIGQLSPVLADRVGRMHLYVLPPSLKSVQRQVLAGCGPGTPGLIIYDGEHWKDTPSIEQADMPAAIERGKGFAQPSGCDDYGIAPDGQYVGVVSGSCAYDLNAVIHRQLQFDGIALFNIQAQRLLSDDCNAQAGVRAYAAFVSGIARDVRAKNAKTKVVAQMSFRYTPPDRMISAMQSLRGVADGFYIAYPMESSTPCAYCSVSNLTAVLRALRSL